jgi:hypothetical protein
MFQQLPRSHGFATPNGSSRNMPTVSRLDACEDLATSIRCFAISNVGQIVNQLHSSKPLPTRVAWDWRTAAHHIVKDAPVLLYVLTVLQNVIYPTHEPVRPLKIKCLLVPAVAIDGTATVAIGQRQGGSIVRQRATEAHWGWPPDLVNHETQVVVGTGRAATAKNCVRGGRQRDGSQLCAIHSRCRLINASPRPWNRIREGLVAGWIIPVVFGSPLVDVIVVVVIDIPGMARRPLQPIECFSRYVYSGLALPVRWYPRFKEDPMANQLIMSYCVELQGVAKAEGTSTQANQVSANSRNRVFIF